MDLRHLAISDFKTATGSVQDIELSYQVFGKPLHTAPIVLVNHALTGNSNVAGKDGWWSDLIGDFDHDGEVGFNDFLGFADSFGRSGAEGHDERHDMDANGTIDFSDFLKFAGRFGDKL